MEGVPVLADIFAWGRLMAVSPVRRFGRARKDRRDWRFDVERDFAPKTASHYKDKESSMTQCKLFISSLLSVIVFCPTFAWAQFDNLTSRIPDGANMIILVDVDRLLDLRYLVLRIRIAGIQDRRIFHNSLMTSNLIQFG